jgi:hypothetical protein
MRSKLPAFLSRELTSPDFSRAQPDPALPWFASSKLSPPHIPLSYIHSLHSNFSSLHLDSIITVPQPLHPVLTTDKRSIFLTSHFVARPRQLRQRSPHDPYAICRPTHTPSSRLAASKTKLLRISAVVSGFAGPNCVEPITLIGRAPATTV